MGLREDVEQIEKKVEKTSFGMEMLHFSKEQNKQQHKHNVFLCWIIVLLVLCLVGSNAYWIYQYTHTTIEEVTETYDQDVSDIDSVGGNIINGDNYGEDKAN